MKPTGYIIYEGPSVLDGAPIVAIATVARSKNTKTGDMVQTYIMRSDIAPQVALMKGDDVSVCGDCKHRPIKGGACYVAVGRAPRAVWEKYKRGGYPADISKAALATVGRVVRLGSYGDPAVVPFYVWSMMTHYADWHTGYTHQWAGGKFPELAAFIMASVDTPEEREQAQSMGWRTFRVRLEHEALTDREFVCPASEEAGKRATCVDCGACNGAPTGAQKGSPVIINHGPVAKRFIQVRAALVKDTVS